MRLINRLIKLSGGDILLGGRSVLERDEVELRRDIGHVIQQVGLFPHMTVAENIATVPRLLGWKRERIAERTRELLELIGMHAEEIARRYPSALSGGQRQIADLKKLGSKVVLGGAPTFATRLEGLLGLKKDYGINPTFKPIAIGLGYTALNSGKVNVQDVFTTDGQLSTAGKYVILTDTDHVFGFQNVVPVVQKKLLAKEGPAFAATLNKVDALLSFRAMGQMNKAVSIDQQQPAAVATAFLKANGIG
jgi:hypothetical protein